MNCSIKIKIFLFMTLACLLGCGGPKVQHYDVVIYCGTSAAVTTAIEVKNSGKSVVILEPTYRLGGLTTGGLGQTDIGNKHAIGGLSRHFYERLYSHYHPGKKGSQWTFEPSAALKVFNDMIRQHKIPVVYGQYLDREKGVMKKSSRISSITMLSGKTFFGKVFVDCSYEGDLLAAAGVSYTVGREARSKYGENLNGVQTKMAKHHQFVDGVDPYIKKGDPNSGLLPFIDRNGPGEEDAGDKRVQAYCFRMCLTYDPENRIPFKKPKGYNEQWYELLFRNFEAGAKRLPFKRSRMPNKKTDSNNERGFSTDFIGQNYDYPEASYKERKKIVAQHLLYQKGLMWTLANHPRVPEHIRKETSRCGTCKDEFVENDDDGWQQQLYIREARRMVSDFVMTQLHCQGRNEVFNSVGMGAYTMDSHHVQRHLVKKDGKMMVKNEGDVQVGGFPPYPISYKAIVPKEEECSNLLVPVCLSASHMAFGSIRMEPVFMVLGQSSGAAAVIAIDDNVSVQKVNYSKLKAQLLKKKQILTLK